MAKAMSLPRKVKAMRWEVPVPNSMTKVVGKKLLLKTKNKSKKKSSAAKVNNKMITTKNLF